MDLKKYFSLSDMKSKTKHFIWKLLGRYRHLTKGIDCQSHWYGNAYGGFYACPDLIDEHSIVYSFGIGEDISFDKALIEKHDCKVFGFDPTPKSISYLNNQNLPSNFSFFEWGIHTESCYIDFFLPKNKNHVSGSIIKQNNIDISNPLKVEMKCLKDITAILGHQHIAILKMDVEGAEYEVLDDLMTSNIEITQIVVEFHDRFFKNGHELTKQTIEKLQHYGFEIFAVSSTYEEISFINRKKIRS